MTQLNLVDTNGQPLSSVKSTLPVGKPQAHIHDDTPMYLQFEEWCAKAIITTNRAAWEYQQGKIEKIMEGWQAAVTYELKSTNAGLLETLKVKDATIAELKNFTEETIQKMTEMEIAFMKAGGKLSD